MRYANERTIIGELKQYLYCAGPENVFIHEQCENYANTHYFKDRNGGSLNFSLEENGSIKNVVYCRRDLSKSMMTHEYPELLDFAKGLVRIFNIEWLNEEESDD